MNHFYKLFSFCLIGFTLNGCVSTTLIRTNPKGAKVYADGEYLGKSPVQYSSTKIAGSTTMLEFKKEGYETLYSVITRSGQANVGAIVGGVLTAWTFVGLTFFFWTTDYQPGYSFELEPQKAVKK